MIYIIIPQFLFKHSSSLFLSLSLSHSLLLTFSFQHHQIQQLIQEGSQERFLQRCLCGCLQLEQEHCLHQQQFCDDPYTKPPVSLNQINLTDMYNQACCSSSNCHIQPSLRLDVHVNQILTIRHWSSTLTNINAKPLICFGFILIWD